MTTGRWPPHTSPRAVAPSVGARRGYIFHIVSCLQRPHRDSLPLGTSSQVSQSDSPSSRLLSPPLSWLSQLLGAVPPRQERGPSPFRNGEKKVASKVLGEGFFLSLSIQSACQTPTWLFESEKTGWEPGTLTTELLLLGKTFSLC